jgi:dihydrofolate synthase/folylpolyglutamate synthase
MTPADAIAFLHDLPRFAGVVDDAYRPGLERMEALMDAMDRPHTAFPSVHVAGTNGKGSTASMIAAIATADGQRTGLHTSPHLTHVTERMRIDGKPAPTDWLAEAVARYRADLDRIRPSFFEATVALSFLYFAEQQVDRAVVEVGLGGRLDATNVLQPELALITSIDLEHTALLGDTHAAIAVEKAGIIKPGVPVLLGVRQPDALDAIRRIAREREAPLHALDAEVEVMRTEAALDHSVLDVDTPVRPYEALRVGLGGAHQQRNALLAVRAAERLGLCVAAIRTGLRDVRRLSGLRGRLEVLQHEPLVVADVAHNPSSLAATLDALGPALEAQGGRLRVLLGLMRDKDVRAIAERLEVADAIVTPVGLPSERALPAEALRNALTHHDVHVTAPSTVEAGITAFLQHAAADEVLLITGSHQVIELLVDGAASSHFASPIPRSHE